MMQIREFLSEGGREKENTCRDEEAHDALEQNEKSAVSLTVSDRNAAIRSWLNAKRNEEMFAEILDDHISVNELARAQEKTFGQATAELEVEHFLCKLVSVHITINTAYMNQKYVRALTINMHTFRRSRGSSSCCTSKWVVLWVCFWSARRRQRVFVQSLPRAGLCAPRNCVDMAPAAPPGKRRCSLRAGEWQHLFAFPQAGKFMHSCLQDVVHLPHPIPASWQECPFLPQRRC